MGSHFLFGWLLLTSLSIALSGCATMGSNVDLPSNVVELQNTQFTDCEVTLQLHHDEIKAGQKLQIESQEACIKKAGGELVLPSNPMYLRIKYDTGRNAFQTIDQLCMNVTTRQGGQPQVCEWNQRFHSSYPFDIIIKSTSRGNPSNAKAQPLNHFIRFLRILRNGTLVYTWDGNSPMNQDLNLLNISGGSLTDRLMPFEADLDLRIVPSNVVVDTSTLSEVAIKYTPPGLQALRRLKESFFKVLAEPSLANGKLLESLDCFHQRLHVIEASAQNLKLPLGSSNEIPKVSTECNKTFDSQRTLVQKAGFSLLDEYEKLKGLTASQLKNREQELEDKLRKLTKIGEAYLDQAKRQAKAELTAKLDELAKQNPVVNQTSLAVRDVRNRLGELDSMAEETLGLFDSGRGLALELKKDAVRLAHDKLEQAHLFDTLASSLSQQGSLFVPWTENPKPLVGEKQLHMLYADRLQFFFLAPWTMVAFRVTGSGLPSLNFENVIPAIDIGGMRLQWRRNRFADFRLALGLVYVRDQYEQDGTQRDDRNLAIHLNAGIGNFKLGLGYTVTSNYHDVRALRVLLGVDLIKLITGQNIEVQ